MLLKTVIMSVIFITGISIAEKWTTDNVLTSEITVEDQVMLELMLEIHYIYIASLRILRRLLQVRL